MEIKIFTQQWPQYDRYIITSEAGSVLLEIHKTRDLSLGIKTELYSLWVTPSERSNGYASALMDQAEQIARDAGEPDIYLHWDGNYTPEWVKEWYERRGYKGYATLRNGYLCMKKYFNEKK